MRQALTNIKKRLNTIFHTQLDTRFMAWDKPRIRRTQNLLDVPSHQYRRGGKTSYLEWGHVIGIFQTLFYQQLDGRGDARILDVGCGTGLLAIASQPFVQGGGQYTGIDVGLADITFCQAHYANKPYLSFKHLPIANAMYAQNQSAELLAWDVPAASQDLVTALSVWTHLAEPEAHFYFPEIERVLKPNGKAIITFFLLDEVYKASLAKRTQALGIYHRTPQTHWIFDKPLSPDGNWCYPSRLSIPEQAIGVTTQGIEQLLANTSLTLTHTYLGNWKEQPGIYFQDVLIFQKHA